MPDTNPFAQFLTPPQPDSGTPPAAQPEAPPPSPDSLISTAQSRGDEYVPSPDEAKAMSDDLAAISARQKGQESGPNPFAQFISGPQGSSSEPKPSLSSLTANVGAGANDTLAHMAGAPVDLVTGMALHGPGELPPPPEGWQERHPDSAAWLDAFHRALEDPFGGSKSIEKGLGEAGLSPDQTPARNEAERTARATGAGIASMLPFGGGSSFGDLVGLALTGGTAGGAGQIAKEAAPAPYKPLAETTGQLVGGGMGAAAYEAGRGLLHAFTDRLSSAMSPFTSAGREQAAANKIAGAASDLGGAKAALANETEPLIPGSEPTTYQATGDQGLGNLERYAAKEKPEDFLARRGQQNAARVRAIEGLAPEGSQASAVGAYFTKQLNDLDDAGNAIVTAARNHADTALGKIGGLRTPEEYGQTTREAVATNYAPTFQAADERLAQAQGEARGAVQAMGGEGATGTPEAQQNALQGYGQRLRGLLQGANDAARKRESDLWNAIDPNGTLTVGTAPIKAAARQTVESMPRMAEPMGAQERGIFDAAASMQPIEPFSELKALRQRLTDAMRKELWDNGRTPAYARMSNLLDSVHAALESRVDQKAEEDAQAVAAGTMAPEDTLGVRLAQEIGQHYIARNERVPQAIADMAAGRSAGAGVGAVSGRGPQLASGRHREELSPKGGPGSSPGDQGLSSPTFDASAAERYARARQATRERIATFEKGSPGKVLAPGQMKGEYKLPDSQVAASFFNSGKHSAEDVRQFLRAFGAERDVPSSGGITPSTPEPPSDIRAQIGAMLDPSGTKDAVFVAHGNEDGIPSDLPPSVQAVQRSEGTLLTTNPQKAQFFRSAPTVNDADMATLLGYPETKQTVLASGRPTVVQARDADGNVVAETAASKDRARQAADALREQAPTATIAGATPEAMQARRAALREKESAATGKSEAVPRDAARAQAIDALKDYAAFDLRRAAEREDGTLNLSAYRRWIASHQDALSAFPELRERFDTAAKAQQVLEDLQAQRKALEDAYPIKPGGTDADVIAKYWRPGGNGAEAVKRYVRDTGGGKAAIANLADYAAYTLRQAAERDGVLTPRLYESWVRRFDSALSAFPQLKARFADAATAQRTVEEAAAAHAGAVKAYESSAAAHFLGADPIKAVRSAFASPNPQQTFRDLVRMTSGDDAASNGLRRAVVDYVQHHLVGNAEAGNTGTTLIKSDQFQTFVKRNRPALAQLFDRDQMNAIEAVAQDLQRANRSVAGTKLPGGSNTPQDIAASERYSGKMSLLGRIIAGAVGTAAGHYIGAGMEGGVLGFLGGNALTAMREAGIKDIDDLVADAMLNPSLARTLLLKVGNESRPDISARLIKQLSALSGMTATHKAVETELPADRQPLKRAHGGRVAPEAAKVERHPSEAQIRSGNYRKGHVSFHGLDITLENAKGSMRRGVGKDGKPWAVRMPSHYGYFKRTEGADGDAVDAYLGPDLKSDRAYIVDQIDADTGKWDEHKVLLGFDSLPSALECYRRAFSDGKGEKRIGNVRAMSIDKLKRWLDHADTTEPIARH